MNTNHTFKVGDKGKTHGGMDYEIIEDDRTDVYPFLARVAGVETFWYRRDGTYCNDLRRYDLLPPAPAPQPSTPALQWTVIVGEKSRTYIYADGSKFTVENVTRVAVRPTNHRLETADGKKFIVRGGYVAIELDTQVWSA